jgi:hypothetical protein
MNEREKAEALSRALDATIRGEDAGPESADEEIRALSALGRSLGDIEFEPSTVHKAAAERLLLKHRKGIQEAVTASQGRPMTMSQESPKTEKPVRQRWLIPLALAGGLAIMFVCVVVAVVGGRMAWRAFQGADSTTELTPAIIAESEGDQVSPTSVAEPEADQVSPLVSPTAVPVADVSEPQFRVFVPSVFNPLAPHHAKLLEVRGVVEVQTEDGVWAAASRDEILESGQRVRTGALSSAQIAFYDGSVAYLEAETEVSLDHLGQADDQSRIVELTQWVGETDHNVAPAYSANGHYEVHTPSGSGVAKGTFFHVSVTPALVVRFSVDEGAVEVTNVDVTVIVVAGQLTTITVDEPPAEPAFRVTGEGEVTEVGETWVIAGKTFATHGGTIIVGNPQPGDWVHVDGHLGAGTRVADRIVLLYRSPTDRFTITGEVEARGTVSWRVARQEIAIGVGTDIEDEEDIKIGDLVHVEGVIEEGGTLLAESIRKVAETGLSFTFVGVVEGMTDTYWTISGISVTVGDDTVIYDDPEPEVGHVVQVSGVMDEEGAWLATEIKLVEETLGEGCLQIAALVLRVDEDLLVLQDGSTLPLDPKTVVEGNIQADSVILFYLCFDAEGNVTVVSVVVIYQLGPVVVIPVPEQPPSVEKKVTICHKPGTPAEKTITISESAWPAHKAHGDTMGPCGGGH